MCGPDSKLKALPALLSRHEPNIPRMFSAMTRKTNSSIGIGLFL